MPTITNKEIIDKIIAGNGLYGGDPLVYRITEYEQIGRSEKLWGIEYDPGPTAYHETEYVRNPKVIFEFAFAAPFRANTVNQHMSAILEAWCKREGLPFESAEDLKVRKELTAMQDYFLMLYIQMLDELNK